LYFIYFRNEIKTFLWLPLLSDNIQSRSLLKKQTALREKTAQ